MFFHECCGCKVPCLWHDQQVCGLGRDRRMDGMRKLRRSNAAMKYVTTRRVPRYEMNEVKVLVPLSQK